jgi:hypothetical protein
LRRRLERIVGREVGIARLPRVEAQAPLVLADVVREGRPLVDRGERWTALRSRHEEIERRAEAAYAQEMAETREALDRIERRAQGTG